MPFELGIQVWKIMSFRWRPSSWMQFSILRLKSSIARANSCWSIVSTSCRMASFNSLKLRGLSVYTRPFRYPQRHTVQAPMNVLRNMFPGCHISRFGDVPWPPRSSDLSSCDFFLWGYLKGRVYTQKPRNLSELDAIRKEVLTIDQQLLGRAMDDFKRRIENCIQEDVRHLNYIIFHTWIPNSNGMSWPLIL